VSVYTVVATMQSGDNDPVEMRWYRGADPLAAMVAVGQVLNQDEDNADLPIPVTLLGVRVDVQTLNDPAPCERCGWQYDEARLAEHRAGRMTLDPNPTHLCEPGNHAHSDCDPGNCEVAHAEEVTGL